MVYEITDVSELFMAAFLMVIGLIVMAAAIEKWALAREESRHLRGRGIAEYQYKRMGYVLAIVGGMSSTIICGYNIALCLA